MRSSEGAEARFIYYTYDENATALDEKEFAKTANTELVGLLAQVEMPYADAQENPLQGNNKVVQSYRYEFDSAAQHTRLIQASLRMNDGSPGNFYEENYVYANGHWMNKIVDPRGNETSWSYEDTGNDREYKIKTITFADDESTTLTYGDQQVVISSSFGFSNALHYDEQGSDSYREITYTYDRYGNGASQTDELGRITSYEYDRLNRLVKKTLPTINGQAPTESYTYDMNHNISTAVDVTGVKVQYAYDELDYLVGQTVRTSNNEVLQETGKEYGTYAISEGKRAYVVTNTDPVGRINKTYYDEKGRVVKQTSVDGNAERVNARYEYDVYGNLIKSIDGDGRIQTTECV